MTPTVGSPSAASPAPTHEIEAANAPHAIDAWLASPADTPDPTTIAPQVALLIQDQAQFDHAIERVEQLYDKQKTLDFLAELACLTDERIPPFRSAVRPYIASLLHQYSKNDLRILGTRLCVAPSDNLPAQTRIQILVALTSHAQGADLASLAHWGFFGDEQLLTLARYIATFTPYEQTDAFMKQLEKLHNAGPQYSNEPEALDLAFKSLSHKTPVPDVGF